MVSPFIILFITILCIFTSVFTNYKSVSVFILNKLSTLTSTNRVFIYLLTNPLPNYSSSLIILNFFLIILHFLSIRAAREVKSEARAEREEREERPQRRRRRPSRALLALDSSSLSDVSTDFSSSASFLTRALAQLQPSMPRPFSSTSLLRFLSSQETPQRT